MAGGGQMGELMRAKDWSKTSLGDPAGWSQSLKITLGIILNSKFSMFLWWGPELNCFYNDAYRPSLGIDGKHPSILGMPAKEAWPEIWEIISPLINKVVNENESIWFEDKLVPIYRNGKVEDVYWTFSYSPVPDDVGKVAGVLVTCVETTDKINSLQKIAESKRLYETITQNTPDLIYVFDLNYRFTYANEALLNMWARTWEDSIGKSLLEVGYEPWHAEMHEREIDQVIATQKAVRGEVFFPHATLGKRVYDYILVPVIDHDGKVEAIAGTTRDITHQVEARQKIEEANKRFRNTVKQAPIGITILRGSQYVVEMANDAYLQLVDKKEADFVGKPLFESLPEVREVVSPLLDGVLNTGIPFHGNEVEIPINRYGKEDLSYFDFLYSPLREECGMISGIIVTVTEVKDKVEARKKVEQNEDRLKIVVEASELGTWELNVKTMEPIYSQRYLEIIGGYKTAVQLTHDQLLHHLHPDDLHIREKAFEEALASGYLHYEARVIWIDQSIHWMEGKGKVFYDANNQPEKLIGTIRNITIEKNHQQKVEESEKRFRNLVMQSPIPKAILRGKEMIVEMANVALLKNILQREESEVQGKSILDVFPELKQQKYAQLLDQVYTTGEIHSEYESLIFFNNNDDIHKLYIDFEYAPLLEMDNSISGIKITIIDVTEKVEARKKVEESEKRFRSLTESIPQLIWETDAKGNALFASGRWLEYTGITPNGESEWRAMIHPDDFDENARIWNHSLTTGEIYRCDVRIKNIDGDYRWHTVLGAPVFDKDNNVVKWVGSFTDIHNEKAFTYELEKQVAERTKELEQKNIDLERMNSELQSFAYISSHDLQEPLRKIQTFATQIMEKEADNLSENGKDKFRRMYNAAQRMQALINDLLAYSRSSTKEKTFEKIELAKIIEEVKEDLKEELHQRQAMVQVCKTCELNIIPFQFRQLIYNLVSNSLKFSRSGILPSIKINCEIVSGSSLNDASLNDKMNYCHINIADNGIGFDQQYSKKIFEVFQRLHGRSEYSGTGIGLAIVKKIVDNHNGIIIAKGELDKGATFDIYIPV